MLPPIELVRPAAVYESSFRAGLRECASTSEQMAWVYLGESAFPSYFVRPFAQYVEGLLEREVEPPPGFVCDSVYWAVCGDEVVGRISFRHRLNAFLFQAGGHIGYIVRPSWRRRGIASEMLRRVLHTERARVVENLLVTCDEGNVASERTIRKNGGELINIIPGSAGKPGKMRFWITIPGEAKVRWVRAGRAMAQLRTFYDTVGYGGTVTDDDRILMATIGTDLVGVVRLVSEDSHTILRGMYVEGRCQRQRLGSKMLHAVDKLLREDGETTNPPADSRGGQGQGTARKQPVYLTCGSHLEEFYGQIGFQQIHPPYTAPEFLVERSLVYHKKYGNQTLLVRPETA